MEPANLNSPTPDDEKLAQFLRSTEGEQLPDDGFSARVLAALPPPRPAPLFSTREWLLGGFALGLVLLLAPHSLPADLTILTATTGDSLLTLLTALLDEPAALVVIAVTVGTLLLTEQDDEAAPVRTSR